MKRTDTKRRFGTIDPRAWRLAGLLSLACLVGACGSARAAPDAARPAPVDADAGPEGRAADPEEPADRAADGAVTDSATALEERLVAMARATRGPEPELLPIKPFGMSWSPPPKEGHAFSVRIYERPTGRKPAAIEGAFAGRAVRFSRYGAAGKWLGVGAVPIGRSDPGELELRFHFEDGSTHEQSVRIAVEPTSFPSSRLSVDPRYSSPPAAVLERIRRESAMVREMLGTATPEWRLDGPFQAPRPLDVTSPFGQARTFNGELRSRHTGVDLRGQAGEPVYAAGRGRVAFAGELYFAGNAVYIDHGLGAYTGYFHLSGIEVEEGEEVETGRLIGRAGATGRVTGAHLHWYLAVDGEAADALSLLDMRMPD